MYKPIVSAHGEKGEKMRLIDADEAYKVLTDYYHHKTEIQHKALKEAIERVHTVDPVKHGHWIIEDIITYERSYGGTLYEPVYKCSCCGRVTESYVRGDEPIMPEDADFPEFCGNCGAKMTGERREDDSK